MERVNTSKIWTWFGLVFLLFTSTAYANNVQLMGARLSHTKGFTRIVFEFNKRFNYRISTGSRPKRIFLEFPATKLETNLREIPIRHSAIYNIRYSQGMWSNLKIILSLRPQFNIKSYKMNPREQYGYRLVIDLKSPTVAPQVVNAIPLGQPVTLTPTMSTPEMGSKIIVVIDPGHGGKDPGATGLNGIHEKNVVLAISRKIKKDINRIPGFSAVLTRSGDYYLTLRDRLRIARKDHADFFVAIHADAYNNRTARGASVFALSERGATSEAARWIAEKENNSELGGVYLSNKSLLLRSVLLDLSQTATITQSLQIGYAVIHYLRQVTPLHGNRVEQARFVVLKSPDIPSLLVETGFISNPSEERRLSNFRYQNQLAQAITNGLVDYFRQHQQLNRSSNLPQTIKTYNVQRHDTLPKIATRYGVSTQSIVRLNHLRSRHVRPGQVLRIPG